MGEKQSAAFMRLFLVPGMHHCAGGTGPSDFGQSSVLRPGDQPSTSLAAALEAWVEQGRVPEEIIARQSPQFGTASSPARQNRTDMRLPKPGHAQARSRPAGCRELHLW